MPDIYAQLEDKYGIPAGLYERLINVGENSGATATSPKGAYGKAQLMPAAASDMGVDRFDPQQNIEGGAKYLSALYRQFGSWPMAVAAYNEGPGRLAKSGVIPQTQSYVDRVMGMDGSPVSAGGSDFLMKALNQVKADPMIQQARGDVQGVRAANDAEAAQIAKDKPERERAEEAFHVPIPDAPEAPKLDGPPDPKAAIGDPTRVLGQFLPLLAIFGGTLSKTHALGSLKAATAAMNAAKTNDKDALERAHQEWMDKTSTALKQYELQRDKWQDLMEGVTKKREGATAELNAFAAEYGMDQMMAALKTGNITAVHDFFSTFNGALDPVIKLHDEAVNEDLKRAGLEVERDKIPIANRAYKDWLVEHPGDMDGAVKAAGDATQKLHAASIQSERSDENKIRAEMEKPGTATAAYQAIKINSSKIEDAAEHPENYLTPSGSAIVADTFTQAFNGGKAIRGFQAKMLSDDRSLQNNAEGYIQRALTGGKFTPQEIKQMAQAVRRVEPDLKADFVKQAQDAIALARERGEDPKAVIPFGLHDDVDFGDDASSASPDAGAGTPLPLPKGKADLQVDEVYDTKHGPLKWDGTNFVEP